ncbi:pyrroloquinoline quinone biosynthesis protein PqqE [Polyangium spumosum]|uniref:PqqA peptide cyclase n=1 Tax=Polyangium spumosum TaxID=889282 RepID=A0A6N7Q9F1_9BACT|nr:pyrroloquinoline quinone biosynthesis protein PqqE [Polyangium spumosum]MRG97511.1 pyrroloquinoline quinone biosynthesis protein PqqE [Polyangium spumosum]
MNDAPPPLALLLELSHRCPLRCPYCSNPVKLEPAQDELDTEIWARVIEEAAELSVLHVHFSGGEPAVRPDLEALVRRAAGLGLYTNLITSGMLLDRARVVALAEAGLDHVQLSVQDARPALADAIAGFSGAHEHKQNVAGWAREQGMSLTINAVVHALNADGVREIIELSRTLGAGRVEIAHAIHHGFGLVNRAALLPAPEAVADVLSVVEEARERLVGVLVIDYVPPDAYGRLPRACMGGWGRRFMNITPKGLALPCHAAETIPGLCFDSVRERSLRAIWERSPAFQRFRGTAWMREPCRSCERREVDFGGCRCQALALTGDASNADPVCERSEHHADLAKFVEASSGRRRLPLVPRRKGPARSAR